MRKAGGLAIMLWVARVEAQDVLPGLEGLALPELPVWGRSIDIRPSVGYKDNLLLSDLNREASYYLSTGADLAVWRLPVDEHYFQLFASGDYTYYPEGEEVQDESFAFVSGQYMRDLNDDWKVAGLLQYVFVDQVLDVSATEPVFEAQLVQSHTLIAKPSLKGYFQPKTWVEVELAASGSDYRSPLDDYLEAGPRLELGQDYGHRSSVSVAYRYLERWYDTRVRLGPQGQYLGGSLRFMQQEVEGHWRHYFDPDRRWQGEVGLGYQRNEDNGGGFYNYDRVQASLQLRWQSQPWTLRGSARLYYYDFNSQPVSATDPSIREKTTWTLRLRGERKLGEQWGVFAEYEFEQSVSNRETDEYSVNKVGAGVDWEF